MTTGWEFVPGADVQDAYVRQSPLSDLIPVCEAIYLWRRHLTVPTAAVRDSRRFVEWLDNAMQVPTGEVLNQHLSHFAILDRLTIRGQGLTPTKRQQFGEWMSSPKARRRLARYVNGLTQFSPPLYCGETANLVQRTHDHLSAETLFGQRVQDGLVPSWSELELAFYSLGQTDDTQHNEKPAAKNRRTLLELVTTAFSVAGYVSRRG